MAEKQSSGDRRTPADNHIPASFEQAVDALLNAPPKKKPPQPGKPAAKKPGRKKP